MTSELLFLFQYELLFSVQSENDPAILVVKSLIESYPKVDAKLFIGQYESHTACRKLCYNCNPSPPSLPVHLLHCAMVTPVDHALEQLISPRIFLCSQHRHSLWCLSQPGLTGRLKISAGCTFISIILMKCGCVCL